MESKMDKGLIHLSSIKVGDVRENNIANGSGSICSKIGKETCELQGIFQDYWM